MVEPVHGAVAERLGESPRRISRDAALTGDNLVDHLHGSLSNFGQVDLSPTACFQFPPYELTRRERFRGKPILHQYVFSSLSFSRFGPLRRCGAQRTRTL